MESYTSNIHTIACLRIQPCKLPIRLVFRKKLVIDAVNKNFLIALHKIEKYKQASPVVYIMVQTLQKSVLKLKLKQIGTVKLPNLAITRLLALSCEAAGACCSWGRDIAPAILLF